MTTLCHNVRRLAVPGNTHMDLKKEEDAGSHKTNAHRVGQAHSGHKIVQREAGLPEASMCFLKAQ